MPCPKTKWRLEHRPFDQLHQYENWQESAQQIFLQALEKNRQTQQQNFIYAEKIGFAQIIDKKILNSMIF